MQECRYKHPKRNSGIINLPLDFISLPGAEMCTVSLGVSCSVNCCQSPSINRNKLVLQTEGEEISEIKSKLNRNNTPPTKFDHPQLQISRRNIVTFSQFLLFFCLGIPRCNCCRLLVAIPSMYLLPSLLIEWHVRAFAFVSVWGCLLGIYLFFLLMAAFEFM